MREAGFVDVTEEHYQWPTNTWPKGKYHKTLGAWFHEDLMDGLNAMSMAVQTRGLGMTVEEVEIVCMEMREAIKDRSIHAYFPVVLVYGRKPG